MSPSTLSSSGLCKKDQLVTKLFMGLLCKHQGTHPTVQSWLIQKCGFFFFIIILFVKMWFIQSDGSWERMLTFVLFSCISIFLFFFFVF